MFYICGTQGCEFVGPGSCVPKLVDGEPPAFHAPPGGGETREYWSSPVSRLPLRKLAFASLGAALMASGLTVGLGAGVAQAAPACEKIASATGGNVTAKYRVTQEAMEPSVAAGGEITFRTTVTSTSGAPALISAIGQFHPAGFTPISARANVSKLVGGQQWSDETPVEDASQNFTQVKGGGWNVTGSNSATVEITYRAPATLRLGEQLRSGMAFDRMSASGALVFKDIGACITVRLPNPVEAATGSLEGVGLGSVNDSVDNILRPFTDPLGSMGESVAEFNIGKIVGEIIRTGMGS